MTSRGRKWLGLAIAALVIFVFLVFVTASNAQGVKKVWPLSADGETAGFIYIPNQDTVYSEVFESYPVMSCQYAVKDTNSRDSCDIALYVQACPDTSLISTEQAAWETVQTISAALTDTTANPFYNITYTPVPPAFFYLYMGVGGSDNGIGTRLLITQANYEATRRR